MSVLGALGISAASSGMSAANSFLGNMSSYYFGGKQEQRSNERSEAMTERQRRENFKFDLAAKNYDYTLAKQAYDYSNSEEYRLAQAYAENSAKWQVQGLRNAGLNPILAATDGNFRGTFGEVGSFSPSSSGFSSPSMSSSGAHFSSSRNPIDLAEVLRDVSSARQSAVASDIAEDTKSSVVRTAENKAQQSSYEVQSARAGVHKLEADTALTLAEAVKTQAQARQLDSNTALNAIREYNESRTGGVHNQYDFGLWVGSHILDLMKSAFKRAPTAKQIDDLGTRLENSSSFPSTFDGLKVGDPLPLPKRTYPKRDRRPSAKRDDDDKR